MTEAQAIEAICQHWIDGWLPLHPGNPLDPNHVPFTFDNEEFASVPTWARVSVVHTVSEQGSMGGPGTRRFERRGQVAVQLFGSVDVGRQALARLADDVRSFLEAAAITAASGTVHTYAGTTREGPPDGAWHMTLLTVPFWYDQTH